MTHRNRSVADMDRWPRGRLVEKQRRRRGSVRERLGQIVELGDILDFGAAVGASASDLATSLTSTILSISVPMAMLVIFSKKTSTTTGTLCSRASCSACRRAGAIPSGSVT